MDAGQIISLGIVGVMLVFIVGVGVSDWLCVRKERKRWCTICELCLERGMHKFKLDYSQYSERTLDAILAELDNAKIPSSLITVHDHIVEYWWKEPYPAIEFK